MRRRDVVIGLPALATGSTLLAQNPAFGSTMRRVALCIGISEYLDFPDLPSARPDAALIGNTLAGLGFHASLVSNPTHNDILLALAKFRLIAEGADLAVVYVAAHGFMHGGQSHVIPQDGARADGHPRYATIPEAVMLQAISDQPRQKVLFLDTCRELPNGHPIASVPMDAGTPYRAGVHVGYATQPNAPAFDGDQGHSPFAMALNLALTTPGLDLPELSRQVRLSVLQSTSGAQIPWDKSSLLLPVVLNPSL